MNTMFRRSIFVEPDVIGMSGCKFYFAKWERLHTGGEKFFLGRELEYVEHDPSVASAYTPPTIVMERDEMQELADALWRVGIRPTEGAGSAGAMAQAQKHIDTLTKALEFEREMVKKLTTLIEQRESVYVSRLRMESNHD